MKFSLDTKIIEPENNNMDQQQLEKEAENHTKEERERRGQEEMGVGVGKETDMFVSPTPTSRIFDDTTSFLCDANRARLKNSMDINRRKCAAFQGIVHVATMFSTS